MKSTKKKGTQINGKQYSKEFIIILTIQLLQGLIKLSTLTCFLPIKTTIFPQQQASFKTNHHNKNIN